MRPRYPPQQSRPLSPLHEPLHWRAKRDPKAKMLFPQSFLRKGVSVAYVGRNYDLMDLKDSGVPERHHPLRCPECQNGCNHTAGNRGTCHKKTPPSPRTTIGP